MCDSVVAVELLAVTVAEDQALVALETHGWVGPCLALGAAVDVAGTGVAFSLVEEVSG